MNPAAINAFALVIVVIVGSEGHRPVPESQVTKLTFLLSAGMQLLSLKR